ncbi:MAG: site-2 protease family protein, partial [Thermoguttaceae bacterium]
MTTRKDDNTHIEPLEPLEVEIVPDDVDSNTVSQSDEVQQHSSQHPQSQEHPQNRPLGFYVYTVADSNGVRTGYAEIPNPFGAHAPPMSEAYRNVQYGGKVPVQFFNNDFVDFHQAQAEAEERSSSWQTPVILYILTWITTYFAYAATHTSQIFSSIDPKALLFSFGIMTILTCHEMGHFLQTLRYKVSSSLPYFIPLPFGPFGTMGAIIRMDSRIPNMKALFDIGISGPLAGLVPTLIFCWIGISHSYITPTVYLPDTPVFGEPLLFKWFVYAMYGSLPADTVLVAHPLAFAGWVGLFITSLNLLPIGQLDGGHVFYGLLGRRASYYSSLLYFSLIVLVCFFQLWAWTLMLVLLALIGTKHPPTQNDYVDIGN